LLEVGCSGCAEIGNGLTNDTLIETVLTDEGNTTSGGAPTVNVTGTAAFNIIDESGIAGP